MERIEVDYLIVGQGLAGSAMAAHLLMREKSVYVIDQFVGNTSSRVAAGLFSPITGQRWTKTWMADEFFPYLHHFYQQVEQKTGARFFYPMPVYKPFLTVAEQNDWMARSGDSAYTPYLERVSLASLYPGKVNDALGGLMLRQCGYLDTQGYVGAVKEWIQAVAYYEEGEFNSQALVCENNGITYGKVSARKIIFCQGASGNPRFGYLPLRKLKGETLTLEADEGTEGVIINRGVYVLPAGNNLFRAGSTYNFNDKEPGITTEGRVGIEEKLKELLSFTFKVKAQEWGFRPVTPDRRPFLGIHPECPEMVIFNGLGTKGVSQAPFLAEMLAKALENGGALNKEVDIRRYK